MIISLLSIFRFLWGGHIPAQGTSELEQGPGGWWGWGGGGKQVCLMRGCILSVGLVYIISLETWMASLWTAVTIRYTWIGVISSCRELNEQCHYFGIIPVLWLTQKFLLSQPFYQQYSLREDKLSGQVCWKHSILASAWGWATAHSLHCSLNIRLIGQVANFDVFFAVPNVLQMIFQHHVMNILYVQK